MASHDRDTFTSPSPDADSAPGWHHLPTNPYNPHAWFVGEPLIGPGTWIGAFTVIDASGGLTIGAHCDISAGAQLYSHSTVARCLTDPSRPVERRPTVIGDHVHVGAGAVVLMGSVIGDHSVIAAGAVVTQDTQAPPGSLLVGVPASVRPLDLSRYASGD